MKYVYVLKAGENQYKVGVSVNVKKRVGGIQTGNGHKVYIIMTKLCEHAELIEQKAHKYLRQINKYAGGGSEWFALDPEDVIRICIMINQEPEIDVYANTDLNKQLAEQKLRHKRLEKKLDMILNITQKSRPKTATIADIVEDSFFGKPSREELRQSQDTELYSKAVLTVNEIGKASTSMLQRRLRIGYGRAARLIEELEEQGIVGPADGSRPRKLISQIAKDLVNS